MKLKENCYRLRIDDTDSFLKKYTKKHTLNKIHFVHEMLDEIQFPYCESIKVDFEKMQFTQRWITGRIANYNYAADRIIVYKMLKDLHATSKQIDWHCEHLKSLDLVMKWRLRFEKFKHRQSVLRAHLQSDYDKICEWTENALEAIESAPPFDEHLTLLHGDVAHHNFIVSPVERMLDFDLAIIGYPAMEELMFVQRVLPMMQYNWRQLVNEMPQLQRLQPYKAYLQFPNELLREWCYFADATKDQQAKLTPFIRRMTTEAKWKRTSFLQQLEMT